MSDSKAVLRKLMQDHVGESNAITQAQLADALGMNKSTLRSELRRLREERQIPIANMRNGYYLIRNKEELQEFIGHVNGEIESRRQTIKHTTEAFAEFDHENMTIPEEPEQEPVEPTYDCAKCEEEVVKSKAKWPKSGPYEDQTVCHSCYGALVMEGQA
jgi:formylmethanofuran dehydrogenase subunit E